MATHSRILAWKIQWTEEPSGLQSVGLPGDEFNCVTEHTHTPLTHPNAMLVGSAHELS